MYVKNESERPGSIYKKAMFVEYTDETFSVKKERPVAEQYLGILGPLIEAGVEDNITVVFKNRASRSHSIYPIGVKYTKPNEGFGYNDAGTYCAFLHIDSNIDKSSCFKKMLLILLLDGKTR